MKMKKIGILSLAAFGMLALGSSSEPIEEISAAEPETSVVAESAASESEQTVAEPTIEEDEKAIGEFIDKWLSADKIAMYFTWVAYIGTIIGLVVKFKQLKQSNNLTLKQVLDAVSKILEEKISEKIAEQFKELTPTIIDGQKNSNKVLSVFAKILALSQENTPESKIAILNLIGELGTAGKELVDAAKTVVEEAVKAERKAEEETAAKLDEIIENNEPKEEYDGTSI